MAMTTDTDPAAILAAVKERASAAARYPLAKIAAIGDADAFVIGGRVAASALDVPLLLGALEAVLKDHRKMTLYALSVYAHDNSDEPRVHCGHAYAETENSRHVMDDDDNIICLDKPEADVCESCRDESGEQIDWPCSTYLAITRELTGKEAGDDPVRALQGAGSAGA